MNKSPFFIIGCVRSGTTMLRDILRRHPDLECPEETHFFRWCDPYGTGRFYKNYSKNMHIKKQQNMDGISETEFLEIISHSETRKELAENYAGLYLKKQGNPNGRWFDKTPQNIYGVLMLSASFPDSPFIHIHRNPLNVVASLLEGKVMPVHTLRGAINYWLETMQIINEYKLARADRVYEIAYEDITRHPQDELRRLIKFIGEDPELLDLPKNYVHREKNKYKKILTDEQVKTVVQFCEPYVSLYNYSEIALN